MWNQLIVLFCALQILRIFGASSASFTEAEIANNDDANNSLVEWTAHSLMPSQTTMSIGMSANGSVSVLADHDNTAIYYSHYFGFTWNKALPFFTNSWGTFCVSESGQYIVIKWGSWSTYKVWMSTDAGKSYTVIPDTIYDDSVYPYRGILGVGISSSGEFMFASTIGDNEGNLLLTIPDYGSGKLTTRPQPCAGLIVDREDRMFCYNSSHILRSFDFGVTYEKIPNMPEVYYQDIFYDRSGQHGIATGNVGGVNQSANNIFYTIDFGLTWLQSSISQRPFTNIKSDFNTGRYVVVITYGNYVYSSSDYGASFVLNSPVEEKVNWWGIAMDHSGMHMLATHYTQALSSGLYIGSRKTIFTETPTAQPTLSLSPESPTVAPSQPTSQPSSKPSMVPSSQPSSGPSSQPTSAPSCGAGYIHDGADGGCSPCRPGHYSSQSGEAQCIDCPAGTFAPDFGSTSCENCPFPWTTTLTGQTECRAVNINQGFTWTMSIIATLLIIVFVCVAVDEKRVPIALNLFFPTLDVFSDIAYLLTNDFYHWTFFVLGVVFILFPIPFYLYTLYEQGATPRLFWTLREAWWLGAKSQSEEDTQRSLSVQMVVWIFSIIAQLTALLLWLVLLPINLVFLTFWLVVGMFLHLTKVITIGKVWNVWFRVWTAGTLFSTDIDVDTEALNECLREEFYFESMPQFVLQLVNNVLLGRISLIGILSVTQSAYSAVSGFWKYVYYLHCVDNPKSMRDIPVDKSYNIKSKWLGIHWVFLKGKLEPKSKRRFIRVASDGQILPQFDDEKDYHAEIVDDSGLEKKAKHWSHTSHVLLSSDEQGGDEEVYSSMLDTYNMVREASPVEATPVVNYPVQAVSATSYLLAEERSAALSFDDWLVQRLVALMVTQSDAKMCAKQLICAGVTSQAQWTEMNEVEFSRDYLTRIGITVSKLQYHMLSIHSTLRDLQHGI